MDNYTCPGCIKTAESADKECYKIILEAQQKANETQRAFVIFPQPNGKFGYKPESEEQPGESRIGKVLPVDSRVAATSI